ncbi:MAG: c-type cytochrome [Pyrinomonadaceae bacterium]
MIYRVKLTAFIVIIAGAAAAFGSRPQAPAAQAAPDDPAAIYKAKCAMCHGQKAEKHFNATAPEADHVKAILDGKKGEKPPFMPAYKDKGVTEEVAKQLAAYMSTIRAAAN